MNVFLAFLGFLCYLVYMIKKDKQVKGFIAKVHIVDRKSGEIVARNQILKCEHHTSVDALNRDLAKFGLPRKFEFVDWVE